VGRVCVKAGYHGFDDHYFMADKAANAKAKREMKATLDK
jgi:hypothetical protein